jgi:thiol:disulfide interchange protein
MDWLDAVRPIRWLVTAVNSRAVTIYLWHQLAILAAVAILVRAQAARWHNGFLIFGAKFGVVIALVALICWLVGWIEDLTSARRATPVNGRHQAEMMASLRPEPDLDQTRIVSWPKLVLAATGSAHLSNRAAHGERGRQA